MTMIDKHDVLDCLRELSNAQFQRRVWLASSGPEVSSFSEAVCQLFDDTGLGDALDRGSPVFSAAADSTLKNLMQAASRVDRSLSPGSLIDAPQMDLIRNLAAMAIEQISAANRTQ